MKREVAAAVLFLTRLIRKAEKLEKEKVEELAGRLTEALQEKYRGHWYPDNPSRGQAYRCLRVSRCQPEPELQRACWETGVHYRDLGLPRELTLWVDPGEVCCRFGEKSHAFTVATFSGAGEEDARKDVARTVASAVERVTSDYHSGSSSDEDSSSRDAPPAPPFPLLRPVYQVPNFLCQPAPAWRPLPRRGGSPFEGQSFPRPRPGCPTPGRGAWPSHGGRWALAGPRGGQACWGHAR
ncbi:protein BTG3 [Lepisosteus oculatus]|uniref:protein BTG3 n=1 Tax=Lepisosteus oculatus TaxID=7918 RepID=UPI0003EAB3E4|nr:PREDICTED: protein BTG3-like [Lepisosteus oculatus]XP_015197056.1 PREDICTED: protein BTG3-like [Lepisosteus oculatus]